ncbi:MAG: hypothetical protein H6737_03120 [Alphaproteobacteria bacterium]|nr:hypothetical protein [Alphaproteobacteria bacterium]
MSEPSRAVDLPRTAVALAVVLVWAHQLFLVDWVVDDAAISFAYARNLVDGEGLVATPGGERVEGYSNPLWVLLLAGFQVVGVGGQTAAKLMALGLSAVSVWLAWRLADRLTEGRGEALAAPFFLAASAQFAIWNASGLENALFTALMLAGLVALERAALGWAGLAFAGLALTRPEALAYGGIAGLWALALHRRAAWRYWAALSGPVAVHEAFRWAYFAWPLPNTYYAKLGAPVERLDARARGWVQLLEWGRATGAAALLPLLASAPFGRVLPGVVALGCAAGALWLPDGWRVGVLLGLAVAGPVFAPGPPVARLAAHLAAAGLAFGVYAGGDWMRGFRWMSLVAGPMAVLLAVGLRAWVDAVATVLPSRETVQWVAGVGVVGALFAANLPLTAQFGEQPVDFPEMIARRLRYTNAVAERVGLDPRHVSTLDMDMGAHMLWSRYTLVDLAGLVDVPIARHTFADRDFFTQYVFHERRPDFAHLHRHWANASGLVRYPEWSRTYVQLPPYDDDGEPHDGVWIRRDHVLRAAREPVLATAGLVLDEVTLVHGAIGERARVRIGVHPDTRTEAPIRVRVAGAEVPLDAGWIPRGQWRGETLVWTDLIAVEAVEDPAVVEVLVDGAVVGTWAFPLREPPDVAAVEALARSGPCDAAEAGWVALRDLVPSRARGAEGPVRTALSECLVREASAAPDPIAVLERAHAWDHRAAAYVAAARPIAEARYQEGLAARARGDAPAAYRAFSDVLRITPYRAWARRYAEEARLR